MKWFRIAVSGQTTDGREIQREWIEQMAASYDPSVYGARINVEHMRGFMPDGDFGAYGDVLALKAETITVNGEDKLALFAQIKPNDKLKVLNAKTKKSTHRWRSTPTLPKLARRIWWAWRSQTAQQA